MTPIEIVQQVAQEFCKEVSADEADYILWEHTGFPSFWPEPIAQTPAEDQVRIQLRTFFSELIESGE